jgi:P27 family predicted phage terminase small subunit
MPGPRGELDGRKAPPGLSDDERRLFLAVRRQLAAQGTWQESDAAALVRYVRAQLRGEAASAIVERDGMVTIGGRGQPVPHPAVKIARDAERDAHEFARDLLLTPRSRRLAGISETTALDDELDELLSR